MKEAHGHEGERTLFTEQSQEEGEAGKSPEGRDHKISSGEEIPWVALLAIAPLPKGHLEEHILLLQG